MKIQKHIEIVRSTVSGFSSLSDVSCQSVYSLLRRNYATVGITIVNNQYDLWALVARRPDLVFLGMKYVPSVIPGEKTWVSEFLDNHGILHTGSGKRAIEFELDKSLAKQRVRAAGVPTARSLVIEQGQIFRDEEITLRFPLFVKPVNLGGGAGIDADSHVHTMDELRAQVALITQSLATDVLVEEYLPGREFSVAILKDLHSNRLKAMPIELIAPKDNNGEAILSQAVKTSNQELVVAVTSPRLRSHIVTTAIDAFNALGARDYGRIDIRLDGVGVAHFLEANLIPSLISGYGSFPRACVLNLDMDYQTMILAIVNLAFDREINSITETYEHINDTFSPLPFPA